MFIGFRKRGSRRETFENMIKHLYTKPVIKLNNKIYNPIKTDKILEHILHRRLSQDGK